MSDAPQRGLLAQAKRQPGKTATLAILVAMMAFVWGRALLGGEDDKSKRAPKPSPNAGLNPAAAASGKSASSATAGAPAKPAGGEIGSFASAVARLEKWRRPLGIEKAAPLTEELLEELRVAAEQAEQNRLERLAAARGVRDRQDGEDLPVLPEAPTEEVAVAPTPAPNAFADRAPVTVDMDLEVDLVLTGTAIFGDTSYALFGEERVQVGESIGRYRVKAVRPREVDVVFDGKLTVIRMEPPDLSGGTDL